MFWFKSIELMNWDLWDHVRIPMDEQVIMIAGPNGSGKTTFLDAIRILLGARQLSTSRKLGSYLRGDTSVAVVKGVVTNPLRKGFGRRPFTHRGIFEDEATLACVIERKSGTWQRRYAILPGDASVEQIRQQSSLLSAEDYGRDLEKANLPRTLLKILALEQGETNKLCKRTPEQLLEYVLEMQGDKQVMANYEGAKEAYVLSGRELKEQEEKAFDMRRHLKLLEQQAESFRHYRDMQAEAAGIRHERLPVARFCAVRETAQQLRAEVEEARRAMSEREAQAAGLDVDSQRALEEIRRLQEGVRVRREEQQKLLREKEGVDGEHRTLRNRLRELEELAAKLSQGGGPVDPEALDQERRGLLRIEAGASAEVERGQQEMVRLRAERKRLEGGDKLQPPPWVLAMGDELRRAGIEHIVVFEVIEIRDPKWQTAIESVLGRDRFTYLVADANMLRAREIAQRLRYPCYVSQFERVAAQRAQAGSALSQVVLADDRVPRWILSALDRVMLVESVERGIALGKDAVSITPDGYRQDPRGGVYIGVKELYCGGHAKSERLTEIDRRLTEIASQVRARQEEAGNVARRLSAIEAELERERERGRFEARAAERPELERRVEELAERKRVMSQALMDSMTEVDGLNASVLEREKAIGLSDYRKKLLDEERQRAQSDLNLRQVRLRRVEAELAELEAAVPPERRTEAVLVLEESEGQLVERLRVLDEQVRDYPGHTDPAIVEVHDRARSDFDSQQKILAQRQAEHRRGEAELQRARKSYVRVVEQTIARYRRNILDLSKRAGVEVEVHVPKVTEDDESIAQAGIEIRIGFDGKKPVPINHPKLSGGQSVIASLMLLMALTMQEEGDLGGFFILDEPFAHLSVERIDDITRFLTVTRAQFILTTPTTHNLMVYNPARLTLNLRKKQAKQRYAPVPTFLRR
jgi:chromosome segregation ATPase